MQKVKRPEELIAVAARQGVKVAITEAEIVLLYMENHGYDLLTDEEYSLTLHDQNDGDSHEMDGHHTIRYIFDMCMELNEELLLDACSSFEPDAETQLDLRKDRLILEGLQERASAAVPPTLRRYNVSVVEHWKKVVPVMAASWAEAEMKVKQMQADGKVTMSPADYAGTTFSTEG